MSKIFKFQDVKKRLHLVLVLGLIVSSMKVGYAQSDVERVFWDAVKSCTVVEEVNAYLESFPGGQFASEAKTCLARIAPDPATVETALNLSREDRRLIQKALNFLRYNAGSPDGVFGRGTRAAIKRYQKKANAEETGFLAEAMAKNLIAEGRDAVAALRAEEERKRKDVKSLVPGQWFRDCPTCPVMVVLSSSQAIGKYEVTQEEWRAVMSTNPSKFRGHRNPVESVNWDGAKAFVRKLSAKTGEEYRLLSDKEWEYAARAGTTSMFHCGNDESCLDDVAWYSLNSKEQTHPVGRKTPNAFGLYDMHGNVSEWVEDCGVKNNGWTKECSDRGVRGGGWLNRSVDLRSEVRITPSKYLRLPNIGFRVARKR